MKKCRSLQQQDESLSHIVAHVLNPHQIISNSQQESTNPSKTSQPKKNDDHYNALISSHFKYVLYILSPKQFPAVISNEISSNSED